MNGAQEMGSATKPPTTTTITRTRWRCPPHEQQIHTQGDSVSPNPETATAHATPTAVAAAPREATDSWGLHPREAQARPRSGPGGWGKGAWRWGTTHLLAGSGAADLKQFFDDDIDVQLWSSRRRHRRPAAQLGTAQARRSSLPRATHDTTLHRLQRCERERGAEPDALSGEMRGYPFLWPSCSPPTRQGCSPFDANPPSSRRRRTPPPHTLGPRR